jgi:adenylate kinase
LQIRQISTGDVLRQAIGSSADESGSAASPELRALAQEAKPYLERGELVPDRLMIGFIRDRLQMPDVAQGWLLEGYPRTAFQAEELDFLLDGLNQSLDWAIWLDVPETVLFDRCQGRARSDDDLTTVKRRIQNLQDYTTPLLDYYGYKKRLVKVDGQQSPDQVESLIVSQVCP